MSTYKIPVFNGDERQYELWEIKFLGLMRIKKLISVFNDNVTPDPEKNAEAFAELIQCIDDRSLLLVIRDAKDKGKESLDILRNHYRPKGKARIITLYHELTSLALSPGESITDFIIRAETAANTLRQIGETVSDSLLIAMVLKGLPSSYSSFITVTTQRETQQNFSEFKESLRNQEETVRSEVNAGAAIMAVRGGKQSNPLWCSFCKSTTHSTKDCYRRPSSATSASSNPTVPSSTRFSNNKFCTKCKTQSHDTKYCKRFCEFHQNDSHWTSQCRSKPNQHHAKLVLDPESNSQQTHSFTFMLDNHPVNKPQASENLRLLVDSGASTHIVTDRKFFKLLDSQFRSDNHVIELANGEKTSNVVQGCGDAIIPIHDSNGELKEIVLKKALLVPSFKQNIFSVSAATQSGAKVNFLEDYGILQYNGFTFHLQKCQNLYYVNSVEKPDIQKRTMSQWHEILGHCNAADIRSLAAKGDIHILDSNSELDCETCVMGKMTNCRNRQPDAKAESLLEKVHLDLAGPIDPAAKDGFRYALVCVDDYSGISCVYLLKNKSDTPRAFQKYLAEVSSFGQVQCVRSDGGGEFISREFKDILLENKIKHEMSCPASPHQNGTAERQWRTLFEMARCLLIDSGLPKTLWSYALMTSAYVRNRCYNKRLSKTPFEALTGQKPNFGKMQKFGQTCYALVQNPKKLDARAEKGIFVGYDKESPSFLIYFPETESVKKIRCVKFQNSDSNSNGENVKTDCKSDSHDNDLIVLDNQQYTEGLHPGLMTPPCESTEVSPQTKQIGTNENAHEKSVTPATSAESNGKRTRKKPKYLDDYCLNSDDDDSSLNMITHYCYAHFDVPKTFHEAMSSENKDKWNEAMKTEVKALEENETYDIVPLPEGRECVGGKWVYAVKTDKFGNETYKARFVAKGYSQVEGIDYNETFSPTPRMSTIRLFAQVAKQNDFDIHQMDVKAAFLNAPIDCEIYVEQPQGFEQRNDKKHLVLRLKKSLYGLKQSSRNWNNLFDSYLIEEEFIRSINDPCLYYKPNHEMYMLVWVDDVLIASNSNMINDMKKILQSKFRMTDLGQVSYFLGMQFDTKEESITISQSKYIHNILERFGMQDCKPSYTPCEMKPCNHDNHCEPLNDECMKMYKSIVGALIYVMTATRPDISYIVTKLSQYMHCAKKCHMVMAKHTLRYLKGTINEHLTFRKSGPFNVTGFCDADWGNSEDRKSVTGYCFQISTTGPMISWKSRKQPTVALSTCEAEYMSLVSAAQEGKYLTSILNEVTSSKLTEFNLFCDNQGAAALAKNPIKHQRSKHIDIKFHFIRDEIMQKNLIIDYVPTDSNVADLFTKPVARIKLQSFKRHLMG